MRRPNGLIAICSFVCLSIPGNALAGTSSMESLLPKEPPDGWVVKSAPEAFTKETLFEHINGQADLFLQYGFERSVFTAYENKKSSDERIDLDIYDMGEVVQAFGIFSRFRQDHRSAGIGLDSYLDDRCALFYKGKYFVVLQATEPSPSALKALAGMIASGIVDSSPPPKEIGYFPERGLKPGSIEFYPQGLMGRQSLKRGFKATYLVQAGTDAKPEAVAGSPDASLFVAVFDNAEEAETALRNFQLELSKKGGAPAATGAYPGFESVTGQDAYQGKLSMVRKGRFIAGAAGFTNEKDAENLFAELINRIE